MSLYEVTQMLQDKSKIRNDMEEAANLIKNMFYEKYLQKIEEEVEHQRLQVKNNRPKEIELLYALKPFIPHEKYVMVDKLAESIMVMKTIAGLQAEMDKSMHADGVYDIDTNCLADKKNNFANAALLFALCCKVN